MTQNIYDTANQLEREFRELDAYKDLVQTFKELATNEESQVIYDEFRNASQKLQSMQMRGEEPSDEDFRELQELSQRASGDAILTRMMDCEQRLSVILDDINRLVTRPLQEIYADQANPTQE